MIFGNKRFTVSKDLKVCHKDFSQTDIRFNKCHAEIQWFLPSTHLYYYEPKCRMSYYARELMFSLHHSSEPCTYKLEKPTKHSSQLDVSWCGCKMCGLFSFVVMERGSYFSRYVEVHWQHGKLNLNIDFWILFFSNKCFTTLLLYFWCSLSPCWLGTSCMTHHEA